MTGKNGEESLYSSISEFAKQFTYVYEPGLEMDIRAVLGWRQEEQKIKDFDLAFNAHENHFEMQIRLADTNIANVGSVFLQFHDFITFAYETTIYTSKEIKNGRRYLLVLLKEGRPGYYCEIDFINELLENGGA